MRITAAIVGMGLAVLMIVYGVWISGDPAYTKDARDAGDVLVFAGVMLAIGAALTYRIPKAGAIIAGIVTVVCLMAASHDVPDAYLFAAIAGIVSVLGWRGATERRQQVNG